MQIAELFIHIVTMCVMVLIWWEIKNSDKSVEFSIPEEKPKKPKKKKAYPNFRKHTPKVITDEMAWKLEKEEKDGLGW